MGGSQSVQTSTVRVVIIGGGYAGIAVAKALAGKVAVTLINPTDRFYHNIAALRASVQRGVEDTVYIPYTRLLSKGTFVHGRAVSVDTARQEVEVLRHGASTNERIAYDFLVCATGGAASLPCKAPFATVAENQASLREIQTAIAAAHEVAIVGGGPAGIELAGEIRAAHPGATVHLLHAGAELLDAPQYARIPQRFKAAVLQHLRDRGIQVSLSTSAPRPADPLPAGVRAVGGTGGVYVGRQDMTLPNGTVLHPDVAVYCVGIRLNTDLFRTSGLPVDASGQLRVTETLQVEGHPRIFALGDIVNTADLKLAYIAGRVQAPIVGHNILKLAAAQVRTVDINSTAVTSQLKPHRPSAAGVMVLATGPRNGITLFPNGWIVGNGVTSSIKSGGLFIAPTNKDFGYPVPGQYA